MRVGVGEGDVDLERLAVLRLGVVISAGALQQAAEAVVGRREVRLQVEGPQVFGARLPRVSLLQVGVGQGDVRLDVVGLQVEGDLQRIDRLAVAPVGVQADPQVVVGQEGIEVDVDDLLEGLDGVLGLALLVEAHPLRLQLEREGARLGCGEGEGEGGPQGRDAREQDGRQDAQARLKSHAQQYSAIPGGGHTRHARGWC